MFLINSFHFLYSFIWKTSQISPRLIRMLQLLFCILTMENMSFPWAFQLAQRACQWIFFRVEQIKKIHSSTIMVILRILHILKIGISRSSRKVTLPSNNHTIYSSTITLDLRFQGIKLILIDHLYQELMLMGLVDLLSKKLCNKIKNNDKKYSNSPQFFIKIFNIFGLFYGINCSRC